MSKEIISERSSSCVVNDDPVDDPAVGQGLSCYVHVDRPMTFGPGEEPTRGSHQAKVLAVTGKPGTSEIRSCVIKDPQTQVGLTNGRLLGLCLMRRVIIFVVGECCGNTTCK
ncbi:hypothetical protein QCA50_001509 [Cerrena zonata]|uniref:Uncharacterized protein n=1 Tax=Cerrena zonata TaxID=2478898 RepID=A0AAW0GLK5_9APHY